MEGVDIGGLFNSLLSLAGMIAVLGGGVSWVVKMVTPWKKIREDVNGCQDKLDKDYARLNKMEQDWKMIGKAQIAIMNNLITGNSVENLKKVRDELTAHFVDH